MKDKLVESLVEQCVAYRGWMVEQLQACIRNYEAADATKKEKAHAWTARMFLQGGIAEFDRRVNVREAASRLTEGTRGESRYGLDVSRLCGRCRHPFHAHIAPGVCAEREDANDGFCVCVEFVEPTTDRIEASVSAASRPAQTWQPIESAPKDGSVILAWSPYWTHVRADVFWWTKRKAWNTAKPPTHWMPLPAPPGPGAQEQE